MFEDAVTSKQPRSKLRDAQSICHSFSIKLQKKLLRLRTRKKFTVDVNVNRRNSLILAYDSSDIPPVFQTKNPASLMVSGAVASDGIVLNPHFTANGLKICTKEYLDILNTPLLPWMEQNFGLDNVVLIQDSAPSHISKAA